MGAKHKSFARKVRDLVWNYFAELLTGFAVVATVYVGRLYAPIVTGYQSLLMASIAVFMMLGLVIMFNTAQTRVVAEDLWDKLCEGDEDGKE